MAGEILTQLNRIDNNIDAAFEKCRALGATMPSTINSDYLADTIETIPSSADIPVKTAADMTVSGATVTAPAGWYKQAASKTVPTATQATPSISVNSSGLITASATQPAGYVAAGTKSGTKQLTTQAAKTVTPTKSEQTAVPAGVYTTGAVKVAKIPDSYIQPSGTKSITENGTHDVKSYASVEVNVAGSGGGSAVEYEEIVIPEGATSATYTLSRVTAAYGAVVFGFLDEYRGNDVNGGFVLSVVNSRVQLISFLYNSAIEMDSSYIYYNQGIAQLECSAPKRDLKLVLINDPNANAIST